MVNESQASAGGEEQRSAKVIAFFAKASQNCSRIAAQDTDFLLKFAEEDAVSGSKAKDHLTLLKRKVEFIQSVERNVRGYGMLLNDLPGAEIDAEQDNKAEEYVSDFVNTLGVDQPTDAHKRQLDKMDVFLQVVSNPPAADSNTKCPISKRDMLNPYRNTNCSHVYDFNSIKNLLDARRQSRQSIRCPVEGCTSEEDISWAVVVPDPVMRKAVDKAYFDAVMNGDLAENNNDD